MRAMAASACSAVRTSVLPLARASERDSRKIRVVINNEDAPHCLASRLA